MDGSTPEERQAHGARTQSLYRDVNERVRELNEAFSTIVPLGDWVCECAEKTCFERIAISQEEYEAVRADGKRFVVAPSDQHVFHDIENLVEQYERYWVVEKYGIAGELAETVDPRRSTYAGDRSMRAPSKGSTMTAA